MRLAALPRPAALAAIALPLSGESRSFAPGVAERLVDDLLKVRIHTLRDESVEVPGELVEPVQLQVVCRTLWSSLPPDVREIGEAELARIGSASDVLSNYYDEAVRAAAAAGGIAEPELRERLEAAFVTPVGTRGTVVGTGERVAGMPQPAIAELESSHLVRAEWRAGARWFELTHDSLIRPIVASNGALRRRSQRRRERRLKRAVAGLVVVVAGMLGGLLLLGRDEVPRAKGRQVGVVDAHAPLAGLKLVRELSASGGPVAMTTTAGGRGLLDGSGDGRIRVWDISVGREIATLDYGDTGLSSLDVDGSGTQVVAAGRIGLRRWTTEGPGTRPPDDVRFERKDQGDDVPALNAKIITAAAFGPDREAARDAAAPVAGAGPAGAEAAAAPAAAAPAYPVAVAAAPLPASASS